MKRYKESQIRYSEPEVVNFEYKINSDKTKFEDTTEYKDLKKDAENAQKAYDQAVLAEESESVIADLLIILEDARFAFDTLCNAQVVVECEDSIEDCPQLSERALFVKNYREVDLLEKDTIKIAKPFYFDTGTEYIVITKDNYQDYLISEILKEKTDKYDMPIEMTKFKKL